MRDRSYYNIHSNGGLITRQFIDRLSEDQPNEDHIKPSSFKLRSDEDSLSSTELENEIALTWQALKERFNRYDTQFKDMSVSKARRLWIDPLLEALGFKPIYQKSNIEVEGISTTFDLSHLGWDGDDAPVIHTVEPSQDLDEKESSKRGAKTPHDKLQMYLNVSDDKWGIVTNGMCIRILRKFYHTYTKGYIEIDVENIFTERSFPDFRTMYRFAHASRFLPMDDGECILESFYQRSLAAGVKVGDDLRENVKEAIEVLGNGFLDNELKAVLLDDPELTKEYYNEILHVIYRLLFLLYAEQRGMLPMRNSIYADSYSITKLREKTEIADYYDKNTDLWQGLQITFRLLREGSEDLDVFGYNGSLFEATKLDIIKDKNCKNSELLQAIKNLTIYDSDGVPQRISYLDIGVEEIGSIYESLLDYEPRILSEDIYVDDNHYPAGEFFLDPRGAKRKSTGSYFTPQSLVDQLINSALKPVIDDRVEGSDDPESAILDIKVCDPATGSGAFLIAANNYLATRLAEVRTGSEYPPVKEVNNAKRDVLQHCIYGVDLNPMAVELAKVSLWINAAVQDRPLNFLDHHLKGGDSLVGTNMDLVKRGLPADAYSLNKLKGEVRERAKELRKTIRQEKKGESTRLISSFMEPDEDYIQNFKELEEISEEDSRDIQRKREFYDRIRDSAAWSHRKLLYDTWTAAFFWPLEDGGLRPPTQTTIRTMLSGDPEDTVPSETIGKAMELAGEHNFFHWELEFPDVFSGEDPGFDCVLGNPPWDVLQAEEKSFFTGKDEGIANTSGSKRKKLIKSLKEKNPNLHEKWVYYKNTIDDKNNFFRVAGRFNLTAKGKLNFYPLFAEHNRNVINSKGRSGIVIASGIATDFYNQDFFQSIMERKQLASLYDFENREGLFPAVHRMYKFSLLTLTGEALPAHEADFAFYLTNLDHLQEDERHFTLSDEEIELLNPNTKTCPIFRSKKDAELTKKLYKKHPVLIREREDGEDENPWGIEFKQGLFNMTSDSNLFRTEEELLDEGYELDGNIFVRGDERCLPLYEGKMIWQYDHRFAEFDKEAKGYGTRELSIEEHNNPRYEPKPRYWVGEDEVKSSLSEYDYDWFLGFRRITNANNMRCAVFSIFPGFAAGDTIPILSSISSPNKAIILNVITSSFIFDYISRQKIGGVHMDFHFVKQFITPHPERIDNNVMSNTKITDSAFKLTYTSYSLKPFAEDLGYDGPPFQWNPEERMHLKTELDAIVAHLYGVSRDELDYIMETFPIVKKHDMKEFGEYRTKELILKYYDEYEGEIEFPDDIEEED